MYGELVVFFFFFFSFLICTIGGWVDRFTFVIFGFGLVFIMMTWSMGSYSRISVHIHWAKGVVLIVPGIGHDVMFYIS